MNDLNKRLFEFSIKVIQFLRKINNTPENSVIRYQLTKSATSAGANYEEAQAGSSRADFNNKTRISLKEMRESNYWLRVLIRIQEDRDDDLIWLIKESNELKNILGSIVVKTKK